MFAEILNPKRRFGKEKIRHYNAQKDIAARRRERGLAFMCAGVKTPPEFLRTALFGLEISLRRYATSIFISALPPSTHIGTASKPGTKLKTLPVFVGRIFIGLSEDIFTRQPFFSRRAEVGESAENFSSELAISGKMIFADFPDSDGHVIFTATLPGRNS